MSTIPPNRPSHTPEMRARITAATAAVTDFSREANEYIAGTGDRDSQPDWQSWAWRLAAEIKGC